MPRLSRSFMIHSRNGCGSIRSMATCSVPITSAILCIAKLRSDDMRRSTLALLMTIFSLSVTTPCAVALEISPDAYKLVQGWPTPSGTYMPIPRQSQIPQRWNDCRGGPCEREWRSWGGRQVEPRYEFPNAPGRRCRNVYGYLVPC